MGSGPPPLGRPEPERGLARDLLARLRREPTQLAYRRARKALAEVAGPRPLKVAVLSALTVEPMEVFLDVECRLLGLAPQIYWGGYNQFEPLVLAAQGPLYAFEPEAVVVWPDWREWMPELDSPSRRRGGAEYAGAVVPRLVALCLGLRERTRAVIFVATFAGPPPELAAGVPGAGSVVAEVNQALAQALRELSDAHLLPVDEAQRAVGAARWTDVRLWYTVRMGLGVEAMAAVSALLARSLRAAVLPRAKVLVLDLDETLWGGILGEDGPEGIQLGGAYPGNVYRDLQRRVLAHRDRGVLLAIASRNDEQLVRDTLARHEAMVLRPEHFAAIRAGWGDKATSLRGIAEELGLDVGSCVFVDDNPAEIEQVSRELPTVRTVLVDGAPLDKLRAIEHLPWLDALRVTEEDQRRSVLYQAKAAAEGLRTTYASLAEYHAALEMRLDIGPTRPEQVARLAQLTRKTNQFNLTTLRCTDEEIAAWSRSPTDRLYAVALADRFADHGIVGVMGARVGTGDEWAIDLFLLSCRVLGRGVEQAMLAAVVEGAFATGALRVRASYLPTERNGQTSDFYPRHGFREVRRAPEKVEYELLRDDPRVARPAWCGPASLRAGETVRDR